MAKSSNSAVGGVVGFLVAVVLIGGVAGTPFYLGQLRSDSEGLDVAIQDDVESIQRIVGHIDGHLSAVKDIRDAAGEDLLVSPESVADLEGDNPNLFADVLQRLKPTTNALQKAHQADKKRGTEIADSGGRRPRQTIDGRQAVLDVQSKYLKETEKMLAEGKKIAARLKTTRRGEAGAASHLGVNRVLALLNFSEGRIYANRARVLRRRASELRVVVDSRLEDVASSARAFETVEAERESAVLGIEGVTEQIGQTETILAKQAEATSRLEDLIASKEAELSERQKDAAAARRDLAASEARGFAPTRAVAAGEEFIAYRDEYLEIAERLRTADAAIAVLQNGTLAGAELSEEADGDLLNGAYEGGRPESGLRDLRHYSAALETAGSALESRKTSLQERLSEMEARQKVRSKQMTDLKAAVASRIADANAGFEESEEFDKQADASIDAAMPALAAAQKNAVKAVAAAKVRTREARKAVTGASDSVAEHPFKAVADDKEVEASMQVLSAEIAYHQALLLGDRINARRAQFGVATALAVASGGTPPDARTEQLDEWRSSAVAFLAQSESAYSTAENLVRSSRITTASGTFQGQDYVWQLQVGHVAVHLLKAGLATDEAAARASRTAAYNLLRQATEGREQSPLLAQAVDALVYLQQTAR
ncbi:MAG: hypothetical protein O7B26_00315 [Planctomycetota bacterium]|nr:hypothetical protein [Planctomycetota bacterium]